LILPIQLEYWNIWGDAALALVKAFYRYNWSIETSLIHLSYPPTLNSTDTTGVLKHKFWLSPVMWMLKFYRYNWSIETPTCWVYKICKRRFYRYNWSIETPTCWVYKICKRRFYRYNWSIETGSGANNPTNQGGFYRYNWSIETLKHFRYLYR